MKAFMLSVVALVLITAGAAFGLGSMMSETAQQAYTSETGNVRN